MNTPTKCPKCGDETNDGHPGGPCGRDLSEEFPSSAAFARKHGAFVAREICDGVTVEAERS